MEKYILSDEEFRVVDRLLYLSHYGENLLIQQSQEIGSYFKDIEEGKDISLFDGLAALKESMVIETALENGDLTNEDANTFFVLFDKVREYLKADIVILDTKTTGVSFNDEVVEIGVIDNQGRELFSHLIKPSVSMSEEAMAVTGITNEALESEKTFDEYADELLAVLSGKRIMCYNTSFDRRLLVQTANKYDTALSGRFAAAFKDSLDAMDIFQKYINVPNERGLGLKLSEACQVMKIDGIQDHRAVGDCQMTLSLIEAVEAKHPFSYDDLYKAVPDWKKENIQSYLSCKTLADKIFCKLSRDMERTYQDQIAPVVTNAKTFRNFAENQNGYKLFFMTALNDLIHYLSDEELEDTFRYIYEEAGNRNMFEIIYDDELSLSESVLDSQNLLPHLRELNEHFQKEQETNQKETVELDVIEK